MGMGIANGRRWADCEHGRISHARFPIDFWGNILILWLSVWDYGYSEETIQSTSKIMGECMVERTCRA